MMLQNRSWAAIPYIFAPEPKYSERSKPSTRNARRQVGRRKGNLTRIRRIKTTQFLKHAQYASIERQVIST
jgi:hypothetical protein